MWSVWSERSSSRGSDRRSWGVGGWLRCSVPETQLDAAESCFGGGGGRPGATISSGQQRELIGPKWKQEEDEGRTHRAKGLFPFDGRCKVDYLYVTSRYRGSDWWGAKEGGGGAIKGCVRGETHGYYIDVEGMDETQQPEQRGDRQVSDLTIPTTWVAAYGGRRCRD